MKSKMAFIASIVFFLLVSHDSWGQKKTSEELWFGRGTWTFNCSSCMNRSFTLGVYRDEDGFWIRYVLENGSAWGENIPPILTRIELKNDAGRMFFYAGRNSKARFYFSFDNDGFNITGGSREGRPSGEITSIEKRRP